MPVVYVNDLEGLRAAYRAVRDSSVVSLDYETTGLDPHTDDLLLAQVQGEGLTCYVIPVRGNAEHLHVLLELLTDRKRLTLAHNASFEYQFTLSHFGLHIARMYDTLLAEAVLTAGLKEPLGLGDVAERRLGLVLDKGLQKSFIGADPATFLATPEQIAYAAQDVLILPDLYSAQKTALEAEGLLKVAALVMTALPVFAQMEYAGMKLDLAAHGVILERYKADAEYYGVQAAGVLDPFWQSVAERNRQHDTAEYERLRLVITGGLAGTRQAELKAELDEAEARSNGRVTKAHTAKVDRYREQWAIIRTATAALGVSPEPLTPGSEAVKQLRAERLKVKPKPEAPINMNSSQQVLAALAESGISLPNLQADTVEEYAHKSPVLAAFAKYAKAQKIVSTYGDELAAKVNAETGRVHGGYGQCGTATGRTSSNSPNMQNMPKAIRACFIPEPGNAYVVADFAAMEMRIAAGLYQDPAMLAAFGEGKDLHSMTAAAAWPDRYPGGWQHVPKDSDERAYAKIGNFASIYGASAAALQFQMGVPGVAANAIIDGISSLYSVMWDGIHADGEQAIHTGYAITALGRKRYFRRLPPEPRGYTEKREWRKLRSRIVRQAMNHPVQGCGADIAKRAMVLLQRELAQYPGWQIVCFVHDELLCEGQQQHAEAVKAAMSRCMEAAGAELIEGVAITVDVHCVERWTK